MSETGYRIDVWLWRARFTKTRSLAAAMVERGAVRLTHNGVQTRLDKPSRTVHIGSWPTEFFLRGTNLSNAEARPHPSFVKDLAPLAGRGVVVGVRFSF